MSNQSDGSNKGRGRGQSTAKRGRGGGGHRMSGRRGGRQDSRRGGMGGEQRANMSFPYSNGHAQPVGVGKPGQKRSSATSTPVTPVSEVHGANGMPPQQAGPGGRPMAVQEGVPHPQQPAGAAGGAPGAGGMPAAASTGSLPQPAVNGVPREQFMSEGSIPRTQSAPVSAYADMHRHMEQQAQPGQQGQQGHPAGMAIPHGGRGVPAGVQMGASPPSAYSGQYPSYGGTFMQYPGYYYGQVGMYPQVAGRMGYPQVAQYGHPGSGMQMVHAMYGQAGAQQQGAMGGMMGRGPAMSRPPQASTSPSSVGGAQQSQAAVAAPRKSKAIPIINPNTKKEITIKDEDASKDKAVEKSKSSASSQPAAASAAPAASGAAAGAGAGAPKTGTVVLSAPGEATAVVPPASRKVSLKRPDGTPLEVGKGAPTRSTAATTAAVDTSAASAAPAVAATADSSSKPEQAKPEQAKLETAQADSKADPAQEGEKKSADQDAKAPVSDEPQVPAAAAPASDAKQATNADAANADAAAPAAKEEPAAKQEPVVDEKKPDEKAASTAGAAETAEEEDEKKVEDKNEACAEHAEATVDSAKDSKDDAKDSKDSTSEVESSATKEEDKPANGGGVEDEEEDEDDEEDDWETKDEAELTDLSRNTADAAGDDSAASNKLKYDRSFLLGFQPLCVKKPQDFKENVIVTQDQDAHRNMRGRGGRGPGRQGGGPVPGGADDWARGRGARGGAAFRNPRGGPERGPGRDAHRGGGRDARVPGGGRSGRSKGPALPVSENAWKRPEPARDKTVEIGRQTTGLLNKITVEKFEQISERIVKLDITDGQILKLVIKLVFDKAVTEPHFAEMYARLCVKLATKFPRFESDDGEVQTFKRILLNKCQEEFEAKIDKSGWEEMSQEERDMEDFKARKRMLGNIKFIGELFKLRMLSEKIMHECIRHLLAEIRNPAPENVEALCKLMETIGQKLDMEKPRDAEQNFMDQYFLRMKELSENKVLESRVRFMVQDVLDLRANHWRPRRAKEGPKTIDAVHQDAQQADLQAQRNAARAAASSGGLRGRDRGRPPVNRGMGRPPRSSHGPPGGGAGGAGGASTSGWVEVGGAKRGGGGPPSRGGDKGLLAPRGATMGSGARGWQSERGRSEGGGAGGGAPSGGGGGGGRFGVLANGSPDRDHGRPGAANDRSPIKIIEKKATPEKPKLTIEKLEKEAKATLEEFYGLEDLQEAFECIKDLEMRDPKMEAHFVNYCLTETVESKPKHQTMVMDLLLKLFSEKVLHSPAWAAGLPEFLDLYEDLCVDIPRLPVITGTWMGRAIGADVSSLKDVPAFVQHLVESRRSDALVAEILRELLREGDEGAVRQACEKAKFPLVTCIGGAERLPAFLGKYTDLGFLYPLVGVEEKLTKLAENPETSAQAVIDWVKSNVSSEAASSLEFVSILCRVLLKTIVHKTVAESDHSKEPDRTFVMAEHKMVQRWVPVLTHFCGDDRSQVVFLLEVQRVAAQAKFPKGLMQRMFHLAYNDDIITEDAVEMWVEHDSEDVPGKGDSLFQLNSWLTWLREADSESDGEGSGGEA